jgi:hypothetical protein
MTPNNPPAATPTFSPGSGTYSTAQSVTIQDTTPSASIYYTTDGSPPSTGSTLYSAPVPVSTSEMLQAIAIASGFSQSAVGSANYTIGNPTGCNAPSSPGVNLCKPGSGATVTSPVAIQAAATVTGTISTMQVWIDGVRQYSISGTTMLNTSLTVAAGTHRFAVLALNTAGTKWTTAVNATVGSGGGGCSAPGAPGVNICKPVNGSSVASPVTVQAMATVTGTISNMQLWVDGVKKFSNTGTTTLNTSVSLASGSHRFAVLALNTAGTKWETVVNATVP